MTPTIHANKNGSQRKNGQTDDPDVRKKPYNRFTIIGRHPYFWILDENR